eukprot:944344-Prorocentrum_minimum.AAC.1
MSLNRCCEQVNRTRASATTPKGRNPQDACDNQHSGSVKNFSESSRSPPVKYKSNCVSGGYTTHRVLCVGGDGGREVLVLHPPVGQLLDPRPMRLVLKLQELVWLRGHRVLEVLRVDLMWVRRAHRLQLAPRALWQSHRHSHRHSHRLVRFQLRLSVRSYLCSY